MYSFVTKQHKTKDKTQDKRLGWKFLVIEYALPFLYNPTPMFSITHPSKKDVSEEEAMQRYMHIVQRLSPDFKPGAIPAKESYRQLTKVKQSRFQSVVNLSYRVVDLFI